MFKTFRQQENRRLQCTRCVMMKATPAPSLVVAQAEFLFKLLIVRSMRQRILAVLTKSTSAVSAGNVDSPILARFCFDSCGHSITTIDLTWRAQPLLVPMRSPHSDRGKARRQFLVGSSRQNHPVPSACAQRFRSPFTLKRCGARHTLPACPGRPICSSLGGHRPRACCPYRGDDCTPTQYSNSHLAQRFTATPFSLPYPASASTMRWQRQRLAARICSSATWGLV